ncbi:MAG: tetratricopeptide repeat protein [Cyanobacteria bacterium J06600_6]
MQSQTRSATPIKSSTSELYNRAQRHFETQEYHLAIKYGLELLKIEPQNVLAHNTVGMSWGALGKSSAAIAAFNRAIAIDDQFTNAYYNRGYVYQQLGQHNQALNNFERTLELSNGQHVSALINRASIYATEHNYQPAITDLNRVVELNPKSATAYYNRALINLTMGNKIAYLNDLTTAEQLYRQQGDEGGLAQIAKLKQLY